MEKAKIVYNELNKLITNPVTELNYKTVFELLVAVILSAQCTDKRVNMVTKEMFKKYNTAEHFANIKQEELEEIIHPCGFYKNKAKNIIAMSQSLVKNFNGQVPDTLEELTSLSGVGRKTANVMLSVAFNVPAIAVDTHVFRVSNRLGLVKAKNETECEQQLMAAFPKEQWNKLHHFIVLFGRYYCKAIKPECVGCVLYNICEYEKKVN